MRARKYRLVRLKCAFCGDMFEAYRRTQKNCSNRCALKARGVEWFRAHQARMTATRLKKGYTKFVQRMRAAGFTDAQIAVVRRERMSAHGTGYSAGRRRGFAEALNERTDRRPRLTMERVYGDCLERHETL